MSVAVRRLLSSDMASRYTLRSNEFITNGGAPNSYGGTRFMDEVESQGEEIARHIFSAEHVSIKPLSGHVAALMAVASVCRSGGKIMAVGSGDGGYDGYGQGYIPELFSLQFSPLPFDASLFNLDTERACEAIRKERPSLVILGQSFILFPYDVRAVSDACKDAGAVLGYDGSHVMGLIAGGQFQDPLREGADMLFGSTHKSFPGPQGGIFATNSDELWKGFVSNTTWRLMDNAHWNRIAALSQSLLEMRRYGRSYAGRVVRNARALASALNGIIECRYSELGYTRSHQILMDATSLKSSGHTFGSLSAMLEKNDVIVDTTGRLGASEVSRLGMGPREMKAVASIIKEALEGSKVKSKANKLRRRFRVMYA